MHTLVGFLTLYNNVVTIYNEHIKTNKVLSLKLKNKLIIMYAQAFQENFSKLRRIKRNGRIDSYSNVV